MSDIYLSITETPAFVTLSQAVISGAVAGTVTVSNTVTVALDANSLNALENVTVTVGSAVSVSGTVTANVFGLNSAGVQTAIPVQNGNEGNLALSGISIAWNDINAPDTRIAGTEYPLPIQGTVTANGGNFTAQSGDSNPTKAVQIGFTELNGTGDFVSVDNDSRPFPVKVWSGTVTANVAEVVGEDGTSILGKAIGVGFNSTPDGEFRNVSQNNPFPVDINSNSIPQISGTVTANLSSSNLNSVTIGVRGAVTAGISSLPVTSVTYVQTPNANFIATDRTLAVFGGVDMSGARWGPIPLSDNGAAVIATGSVEATQPLYPFTNTPRPYVVTVGNSITIGSLPSISGTVTANVTNSVTIGSLPVMLSTTTIGGTARLNVTLSSAATVGATAPSYANLYGGSDGTNLRAISVDSSGRTVVTGTVGISGTVPVSGTFYQATQPVSLASLPSLAAGIAQIGSVTASISGTPSVTMGAISGTVTANNPSGALTTRFGSVTTANTAQLTAAVTNSARRYLLCQNLDPSVTVTIGIGFTPTTTQGIQLSAGGGIIMDSFVSTGAVWWLSSSTGSNFSILEG